MKSIIHKLRQYLRDHPEELVRMLDLLTRSGFAIVGVIPSLFGQGDRAWQPLEYNLLARRPAGSQLSE
jgi:acetolactate synthase regulatory subunit